MCIFQVFIYHTDETHVYEFGWQTLCPHNSMRNERSYKYIQRYDRSLNLPLRKATKPRLNSELHMYIMNSSQSLNLLLTRSDTYILDFDHFSTICSPQLSRDSRLVIYIPFHSIPFMKYMYCSHISYVSRVTNSRFTLQKIPPIFLR